jgi:hypothetical protein
MTLRLPAVLIAIAAICRAIGKALAGGARGAHLVTHARRRPAPAAERTLAVQCRRSHAGHGRDWKRRGPIDYPQPP